MKKKSWESHEQPTLPPVYVTNPKQIFKKLEIIKPTVYLRLKRVVDSKKSNTEKKSHKVKYVIVTRDFCTLKCCRKDNFETV